MGGATGWDIVTTDQGALIAVGVEAGLDSAAAAVVWHESAGTWTPQALPELGVGQLLGAASTPSGAVVVGSVRSAEGESAAAWVLTGAR